MRNKRIGKKGQMTIKLDISKAHDWVEWDFLWHIMLKLGIDARWVHVAMETVIVASYSMLINGESKGFVTPSKTRRSFIPILVSTMFGGSHLWLERQWHHKIFMVFYHVQMGYVSPISFLRMIALFFAKLLWRNVSISWRCLSTMNRHLVKLLIDRKLLSFLARIQE